MLPNEDSCSLYLEKQGKSLDVSPNPNICYRLLLLRTATLKLQSGNNLQPMIDAETCLRHHEELWGKENEYTPAVEFCREEIDKYNGENLK